MDAGSQGQKDRNKQETSVGLHVITPFRDIIIFPSYSKGKAVVAWKVDPEWRDAEFYIYKKTDGGQAYSLLNTEPVYGSTFTDNTFESKNLTDTPFYRITAFKGNQAADSPEVALYDKTGKKAFGVAYKLLHLKYIQAKTDGIPVLYYPAVTSGKVSSNIDPLTGQRTSYKCEEKDDTQDDTEKAEDQDYGQYYAGGYCPPFLTFIRLLGAKNMKTNILDEGNFQEETQVVEFLPFPPVRTNDLIVDVATDRRWVINKSVKPAHVKGIIPIGYTANMTLLPHGHKAYDVPVPSNYYQMLKRAQPEVI